MTPSKKVPSADCFFLAANGAALRALPGSPGPLLVFFMFREGGRFIPTPGRRRAHAQYIFQLLLLDKMHHHYISIIILALPSPDDVSHPNGPMGPCSTRDEPPMSAQAQGRCPTRRGDPTQGGVGPGRPLGAPRIKHTLPHRACARRVGHDLYRPRHASPRDVRVSVKFRVDRTAGARAGGRGTGGQREGGVRTSIFTVPETALTRYLFGTDPLKKGA